MSKTYDQVAWNFLETVMLTFDLDANVVTLILSCVRIASLLFIINGEPKGFINPSRGLCQGDLISLYLFLLCIKGLIALLQEVENKRLISGIKICRGAPSIIHLLLANGSLIFCKVIVKENQRLLEILEVCKRVSGKMIN